MPVEGTICPRTCTRCSPRVYRSRSAGAPAPSESLCCRPEGGRTDTSTCQCLPLAGNNRLKFAR